MEWFYLDYVPQTFDKMYPRLYTRKRISPWSRIEKKLAYGNTRRIRFEAEDECRAAENEITFLEHVEIEVSLEYSVRGSIQIHLTAPSGKNPFASVER